MTDQAAPVGVACAHCGAPIPPGAQSCASCGNVPRAVDDADIGARETIPTDTTTLGDRAISRRVLRSSAMQMLDDERDSMMPQGPDPLIGLVVAGRYRIVECVGRGGMGVVYKVEHTEIGKLLALKLLAGELSRQREVVRRFKREALLASRLSHPNSVQVFDFGVSDGLTYLVMELVSGRDLARVIKAEGALPFDRVGRMMVQVCSSLAEAHGIGIIHRDLKPENILIARAPDGTDFAKVLDFGLAKLREAPELNEVTGTGQVVGTPYYMSPEQIHGHPIDGRSDIYSLGAVMYEALTGETVFQGTSPMAVFTRHLTEQPIPPRERAPQKLIAPAVEAIVLRALEKDPAARFQTVQELQAALVEQLGGMGQASIDALLSSAQMHALEADIARATARTADKDEDREGLARTMLHGEIATRDEVAAFHRKLARQRWMSWGAATLVAVGVVYGGARAWASATKKPGFHGVELEPNNQASEATLLPFATPVLAKLGKRIDAQRSDLDFFAVDVPAGTSAISIKVTALPNMPMCTMVYKSGETNRRAKFCVGKPGRNLFVPAYDVEPGTWLFAVTQDMDAYESATPFVLENVSDDYQLTIGPAQLAANAEVEPNDAEAGASLVAPGAEMTGTFGWTGDVDVVCSTAPKGAGPSTVRWVVDDAVERTRDRGAVLEFAPSNGPRAGIAMRLHRADAKGGAPSTEDLLAPWRSEPFQVDASSPPACIKLRLTTDPWAGANAPPTPPVSDEHWRVRLEIVANSVHP